MRKTLWIALMAAASVAPGVALAQDDNGWHGHRGNNGEHAAPPQHGNGGGDARGGGHGNAPAPQAQPRPQPQAQPQAQQQVQSRGDWHGNSGWAGRRGGEAPPQADNGQGRSFGGWRGGGNPNAGVDVQAQARAEAQARAQADAQARARQNGGNWRGGDPRNGYGQPTQGYRGPDRPQGNSYGNGYRPEGNGYRPGGNWRDGDHGRGGWNRDWRGSGQYDWQRYRIQNRSVFRLPRYYAPYGWSYGYRRFSIGFTLAPILFSQSYWIDDPYEYRLPDAYGEYRWVRYYNDALLVDVYSGEVVDVVYDIFY